jgi:histidine ammonia-lyase
VTSGTAISLTGEDLTVDDVWAIAVDGSPTALSGDARARMDQARAVVDRAAHGPSEHTYGVNTGFGRFVSQSIPEELTEELQLRLLRSHACGVGEPYPDEIVRAAMLLRANALAKGAPARGRARRAAARVPRPRGAAGRAVSRLRRREWRTLPPLAHLALPLVGEGEAWFGGERLPGGEALERAGLEPQRLRRRRASRSSTARSSWPRSVPSA